jgi:hypothetical protein
MHPHYPHQQQQQVVPVGATPLHVAVLEGQLGVVGALLAAGRFGVEGLGWRVTQS